MREDNPYDLKSKCTGDCYLWRVGGDRVELTESPGGWVARVRRSAWSGEELVVDNCFVNQDDALAWCARMAQALACDLEDAGNDDSAGA